MIYLTALRLRDALQAIIMKRWTISAIFGAVILAVAACGGQGPAGPTNTPAPPATSAPGVQPTAEPAVAGAATVPPPSPTATPVPIARLTPTASLAAVPTPTQPPPAHTVAPTATPIPTPRPTTAPVPTATPIPAPTVLPTPTPIPQPTGIVVAQLRSVSAPAAGHIAPSTSQCEVVEAGQCAELRWERVDGLLAGDFSDLQVAPSDPNVIYALIDANDMSVWRSEDSGASWKRVHWRGHPKDITVHPTNPDIALYVDGQALHRTANGGLEFSDWTVVLEGFGGARELFAVTFSPNEPNIAYAAASPKQGFEGFFAGRAEPGEASIYRSTDTGATWNEVVKGDLGSVAGLAVMPGDANTLFAAASTGVHRSADAGATWDLVLTSGPATDVLGVAISPSDPELVLASTGEDGVFRSTDGGNTWTAANTGLGSVETHKVVFAPSDPNVVYLTTHDGVYRSDDGGQSWSRRSTGLAYPLVAAIAVDPANSDTAYTGTESFRFTYHWRHFKDGLRQGDGLYKTTDGGRIWFRIDADIEEAHLKQMSTHPTVPFNVWINGKSGRGHYFSPDAGETWLFTSAEKAAHYGMVTAFSWSFPTVMYLGSWQGPNQVVRSTDGGQSWSSLTGALLAGVSQRSRDLGLHVQGPTLDPRYFLHVHGLAVAPSDSNVVYAGTIHDTSQHCGDYCFTGSHIFRSSDAGNTWTEMDDGFPIETHTSINAIVVDPTDPNTAYAMTSKHESEEAIGIYKTTDGGGTWSAANNGLDDLNTNDLQIDTVEPNILYAATDSGIFKTTNAGQSWMQASDGLAPGTVYDPAFDPTGKGVRFPANRVFDLALDPTNPLVLYAATAAGVYKTKDGGNNWYAVNFGLPLRSDGSIFFHDRVLEVDATGRVLYASIPTKQEGNPHPGQQERRLYRAVLEPLAPVTFEFSFQVSGTEETVLVESTSNVYDMVFDWDANELRFIAAGPAGTVGRTSTAIPSSLFAGPYTVTVDGQAVPHTTNGTRVTFEYSHAGRSAVVIEGG